MLIAIPVFCMAGKSYVLGDTIYVDNKRKEVVKEDASMYGVVKHINEESKVAAIHYFNMSNDQLRSVEHRVASGIDYGRRVGNQLFFDENKNVKSSKFYVLSYDEQKGKSRSRMTKETKFYPDGKTREEVQLTYKFTADGEQKSYDRKCFYEDGITLKYREIVAGENRTITYYDPNGEVTENPVEKIEPYDKKSEETFEGVERMPAFPGGQQALFKFLSENVKYPPEAKKSGIQGRVVLQFTVDKEGAITDIEVVRSGGHPSLDNEAVRVIKMMPKWEPGTQRGKPVRVRYTMPVNFRL